MALKEFMQHSMEYRGVLGQASKQESKEAYRQTSMQASMKHAGKQVSRQALRWHSIRAMVCTFTILSLTGADTKIP